MQSRFLLIVVVFLSHLIHAQNIKGMYVNGFSSILGNTQREDSLLRFAENNGFNYLTLYEMHIVNANTPLTNISSAQTFANFVEKAKTQFSIEQIGVASENFNAFNNTYHVYNMQHSDPNQRIDVYNLEFEFWVPTSVESGGVYCVDYLSGAGLSCDTAGAFIFFRETLHKIDSLASLDGAISEAYFGWFNDGQGAQIVQTGVDRILLSAYIQSNFYSANYQYNYLDDRLQRLASANTSIKILPLYSAESNFMYDWSVSNPFFLPYSDFETSLANELASWKQNIEPEGIQWFAYSYLPKKNMDLSLTEDEGLFISVYPNPSSGIVNVYSNENLDVLFLYDSRGAEILHVSDVQTVNLKELSSGVYLLKAIDGKRTEVKKLVVE